MTAGNLGLQTHKAVVQGLSTLIETGQGADNREMRACRQLGGRPSPRADTEVQTSNHLALSHFQKHSARP